MESFGPETFTGGTTNSTTTKHSSFQIFYICMYTVTFIVGFIGNGLVIFLTGCRMKTTVNSIWFLNLAIADFIFILSVIIIKYIHYFWLNWSFMYVFYMAMDLNLFASTFFLVVISLDRCLCTWMIVWAQNKRTLRRARIICMIVWVLIISSFFIMNVIPAMIRGVFVFLICFLIPFVIIASSHIAIGVRIKRLKMGNQLSSYRVIIAVVLTFFICCFPYYVCIICTMTAEMDKWSTSNMELLWKANLFSGYLLFLNSCLNPILYVFMCNEYKKKLKQSLLLVLETAFAEDHLDFRRQIQKEEQSKTNNFELLDM